MTIVSTTTDAVATIRIDRPEKLNALDAAHLYALRAAITQASGDPAVRVIVLTGTGRAFCVGADLTASHVDELSPAAAFGLPLSEAGDQGLYIRLFDLQALDIRKPLIAAVNGFCLGGGLELALQCDFIIATEGSSFGLPEVVVSSLPGGGGVPTLLDAVPKNIARRMLLTGERIDARRAHDIGLVTDLCSNGDLDTLIQKITTTIAANGPVAVQLVKMIATQSANMSRSQAFQLTELAWGVLRDTHDRHEGRAAFREKRNPVYTGR